MALVSLAISDGDLDAALAQYEPGAVLEPWAAGAPAMTPSLARSLAQLTELRLPLSVIVCDVLSSTADQATGTSLAGCPVALVLARRRIAGTGPDCQQVDLRGTGATVARRHPDGSWRIAADAWRLVTAGDDAPAG